MSRVEVLCYKSPSLVVLVQSEQWGFGVLEMTSLNLFVRLSAIAVSVFAVYQMTLCGIVLK